MFSKEWMRTSVGPISDDEDEIICESKNLKVEDPSKASFITRVRNNKHLNEKAKKSFEKHFLKEYLDPKNEEYRKSIKGHVILFLNQKYHGVYPTISDVFFIGPEGSDRYCFDITEIHESSFGHYIIKLNKP